ncbi:hypothetical protein [Lactiplantibacillus herbarum]|uniref:hypothetical protein n=1 Tax=Lactiplantibacillus herbarum TaxID=1670446 RepID=UPI00064FAA43|nr:hypothetical protein [Lactiplantibacillus herbarum]
MLSVKEIRRRLRRDLFTIAEDYQIEIRDRLYTEHEYEDLKQMLLRLRELNMNPQHVQELLAING